MTSNPVRIEKDKSFFKLSEQAGIKLIDALQNFSEANISEQVADAIKDSGFKLRLLSYSPTASIDKITSAVVEAGKNNISGRCGGAEQENSEIQIFHNKFNEILKDSYPIAEVDIAGRMLAKSQVR